MSNQHIQNKESEMKELGRKNSGSTNNFLDISDELPEEDEEFKELRRKYYDVSKRIQMDAIEKEKTELEKTDKSPQLKYYIGTKNERIKLLDEFKQEMKEMEKISKTRK